MSPGLGRAAAVPLVQRFSVAGPVPAVGMLVGPGGTGKSGALRAVAAARGAAGLGCAVVRGSRFGSAGLPGPEVPAGPPGASGPAVGSGLADLPADAIVLVDDAQWLDPGLLGRLVDLAEHAALGLGAATGAGARGPAGVLVAARPLSPSSPPALGRLVELAAAELPLARLGPLSEDELANTIAALLGAPPTAGLLAAVGAASHGQPLLVERLVRSWQASGHTNRGALVGRPDLDPPALLDLLLGRVAQLVPGARSQLAVLSVVAPLGPVRAADREVARHLAVGGAAAHGELVDAGLAEPDGLLPPAVAASARGVLTPGELADGAARAAAALAELGRPASVSATHLWRAHRTDASAVATFVAAGEQLLSRNPERALAWFRRAVALDGDRPEGRLGLLRALVAAGDAEGTGREVEAARRALPGHPHVQATVRRSLAALFAGQGLWGEAARQLAEAPAEAFWSTAFWSTQRQLCELLAGGPTLRDAAGWVGAPGRSAAQGGTGPAGPPGGAIGDEADPSARLGRRVVDALAEALVPPGRSAAAGVDGSAGGGAATAAVRDLVALCEVLEAPPDAAANPLEVGAVTALALGELEVARRLLELARPVGLRAHRLAPLVAWVDLRRGAATVDSGEASAPGGGAAAGLDGGSGEPAGAPEDAGDLGGDVRADDLLAGDVPRGDLPGDPALDRAPPAGRGPSTGPGARSGVGVAGGSRSPGSAAPGDIAPRSEPADGTETGRVTVGADAGADGAVLVGLAAGAARARRSGDVAAGGTSARRLAEVLPVTRVDLLNFDAAIELVVLARRFGPAAVAAQLEERLDGVLGSVGGPAAWRARLEWGRLEAAVAARDGTALTAASDALAELGPALVGAPRLAPLARAAVVWQEVMSGRADAAQLEAVVADLRDAGLGWEASQLAGQAAIRVDDAALAKSLLGRARALRSGGRSEGERVVTPAGLSEREVEVARLVLDGLTHKDIGSTLYISPKTVEHHVAHIRQKLGATTRAEFLALLREDLAAGFEA